MGRRASLGTEITHEDLGEATGNFFSLDKRNFEIDISKVCLAVVSYLS